MNKEEVFNYQQKIISNNKSIERMLRENEKYLKLIIKSFPIEITSKDLERYAKEMASDNWKKYSEKHGGKRKSLL